MAPVKFEDNLNKTLEKRTIKPSSDAWSRLERRLEEDTAQKSNKRFWILGIAASITGILLVTTLFLKSDVKPLDNKINIAQDNPIFDVEDENATSIVYEGEDYKPEPQKGNTVLKPATIIVRETTLEKKPIKSRKRGKQPIVEAIAVISETPVNEEKFKSFEDIKVDQIVAHVQELVSKNQSVTENEIDSLLNVAQEEINQQKIYNEPTGAVDAMALLRGVENDLDKSFRNRVLEALVSSVENVATAVAQRNN